MKFLYALVAAALFAVVAIATDYPVPAATFEAKDFTSWDKRRINSSKRGNIYVPFTAEDGTEDMVSVMRLDLVGTDFERGYAHGYLMAKEIVEFQGPKLDVYFVSMVMDIDLSQFPEPLQQILKVIQVKGAIAAPDAFRKALAWVWESEKTFVPQYLLDEFDGMSQGMCATLSLLPGHEDCDPAEWLTSLQQLNMLPELIRMACTAYGAWGKATEEGGLIQMRALDFGGGPFANYTIAAVYRDATEGGNAFVSITFPGFAGVITGVSQSGIGVSEKVWMTYDRKSLQPGSYNGEPDIFVLRDILQQARNRADAEEHLLAAARTWAIFIGVGDYETQEFDLVGYTQAEVTVFTDVTAPLMTGQPYLEHIAYVDKHPQPSHDGPNGTLPTALGDFWGQISLETSKTITKYHQTGDLHIASYDFLQRQMYLAVGRTNGRGEYRPSGGADDSVWKAYNRPYLKFDLNDLWMGR